MTALLVFAMSRFDVPVLEPESAQSVVDSYLCPDFDPAEQQAEQAAQDEHARTGDFPVHAVGICEALSIPGRKGLYMALEEATGALTYHESLEVLEIVSDTRHWAGCPEHSGRVERFAD